MIYVGFIFIVVLSYLIGSIPTAYIFCKALKGIDIRQHGSGNVGATNVMRTIGKIPGIIVLIIDFLKGFVAVTVLPYLIERAFTVSLNNSIIYVFVGMAVIAGHIWTIFLKFKGGKGVATSAGVLAGISPSILAICLIIWIIVFSVWKYISLASLSAMVALPIASVILGKDTFLTIFYSILCMVGVYTHRSNIKRLLQGAELKIVKTEKR